MKLRSVGGCHSQAVLNCLLLPLFPANPVFKKDCKIHVIIEDLLPLVPQSCVQQQHCCFICFLSIHVTFTRYRWMLLGSILDSNNCKLLLEINIWNLDRHSFNFWSCTDRRHCSSTGILGTPDINWGSDSTSLAFLVSVQNLHNSQFWY